MQCFAQSGNGYNDCVEHMNEKHGGMFFTLHSGVPAHPGHEADEEDEENVDDEDAIDNTYYGNIDSADPDDNGHEVNKGQA